MSVWSGWQADLLNAAHLPNTQANRDFLSAWHQHANSNCRNNPVDISTPEQGSGNCHRLSSSQFAQHYSSHASAAGAFAHQIFDGPWANLSFGFTQSSLVTNGDSTPSILASLNEWGSTAFATWLRGGGTGPSAGGGGEPTAFHQGWADVKRSVNKKMPHALGDSERMARAALRQLERARKVRL